MQRLLLHVCCGPCSSGVIEEIMKEYDVTVYFYNPNIDTLEEYQKRANEVDKYMTLLNVKYIIEKYNPKPFKKVVKGLENQPEGGARCVECFKLRLNQSFKYAKKHKFDCVTTTLSVSPYKSVKVLNAVGEELQDIYKIPYLKKDFKKKDGYLKSIQNSKKYNMYRQKYCGCEFSKKQELN